MVLGLKDVTHSGESVYSWRFAVLTLILQTPPQGWSLSTRPALIRPFLTALTIRELLPLQLPSPLLPQLLS